MIGHQKKRRKERRKLDGPDDPPPASPKSEWGRKKEGKKEPRTCVGDSFKPFPRVWKMQKKRGKGGGNGPWTRPASLRVLDQLEKKKKKGKEGEERRLLCVSGWQPTAIAGGDRGGKKKKKRGECAINFHATCGLIPEKREKTSHDRSRIPPRISNSERKRGKGEKKRGPAEEAPFSPSRVTGGKKGEEGENSRMQLGQRPGSRATEGGGGRGRPCKRA